MTQLTSLLSDLVTHPRVGVIVLILAGFAVWVVLMLGADRG